MRVTLLVGVVISSVLLGCGDESRIYASATLTSPVPLAMLTVTVTDGNRRITWSGDDFRPRASNATPTTPEWSLRTSGADIAVDFQFHSSGVVVSQGSILLPRRSDWRWGVTVQTSTADPRQGCFGCLGSQAFALSNAYHTVGRDSVWVVWGGNSISNPVIY